MAIVRPWPRNGCEVGSLVRYPVRMRLLRLLLKIRGTDRGGACDGNSTSWGVMPRMLVVLVQKLLLA